MVKIIEEIKKNLPKGSQIVDVEFEGAKIVLYSKNKDVVKSSRTFAKDLVNKFKKRIEIRADNSLLEKEEKVKKIVEELIPKECELTNIYFEKDRSLVVLELKYPNLLFVDKEKAISILDKIKEETFWTPKIERALLMDSKITESIKSFLHLNNEEYKKFLHKVGLRIYSDWRRGKREEWIRVSYLGAGQQVGRSCLFLQTSESRILLDAGLDTGLSITNPNTFPYLDAPEFRVEDIDAVIISHAHLDHISFLPFLFKMGYKGPVYMTPPTRDIAALMLIDFVNLTQGRLYGEKEIREMLKHTITLNYGEVTDITPDVRITFYNAGHILGSALVHIHIGNGLYNLLYTGDFKFNKTNLLDRAVTNFPRVEGVIMESTYGNKINPPREEIENQLIETIKKTLDRGGNVLIPTFAVGRAQELVILLEKKWREGVFKDYDFKVYFDGMIWDINAIHTAYPEYLNKELKKRISEEKDNPFQSEIFKRVGSAMERQEIIEDNGNVVLTTSGMMNGGPVIEYFRNWAPNEKNSIFFVGYQAANTLGRQILDGVKEVPLNMVGIDEIVKVNMEIYNFQGFSGHSDRRELINWINRVTPKPHTVHLVHGEKEAIFSLAKAIQKSGFNVNVPKNLDALRFI
jgi:KH/beta-lactamase-domain protein